MMKVVSRLFIGLTGLALCVGCVKYVKPTEIDGVWRSVQEEWTITTGDVVTHEAYNYEEVVTDESAYLKIACSSFDVMTIYRSRTVRMEYADRFSSAPTENTDYRPVRQFTATINKFTLTGSDGSVWRVRSVTDERLVMSYDSGDLTVGDETVRRRCEFVFGRVE